MADLLSKRTGEELQRALREHEVEGSKRDARDKNTRPASHHMFVQLVDGVSDGDGMYDAYCVLPDSATGLTWGPATTATATVHIKPITGQVLDVGRVYHARLMYSHPTDSKPVFFCSEKQSMRWMGNWAGTGAEYIAYDAVRDGDWTMVANKDTTDRPGPVENGVLEWSLPDAPTWDATASASASFILTGNEYTIAGQGVYALRARLWIPKVGATLYYRHFLQNVTTGAVDIGGEIQPSTTGWLTVNLGQVLVAGGVVLRIGIIAEEKSALVEFSGLWDYSSSNSDIIIGSGEAHDTLNRAYIRFSKTDNIGGDRTAELLSVVPGSLISAANQVWQVQAAPIDGGTYVEYVITREGLNPTDNILTFDFDVLTAATTEWVEITDHWLGGGNDPGWSSPVKGFFGNGTFDLTLDDDAYGTDFEMQPAAVSDDWDLLALSGDTAGGSTGTPEAYVSAQAFYEKVDDIIGNPPAPTGQIFATQRTELRFSTLNSDVQPSGDADKIHFETGTITDLLVDTEFGLGVVLHVPDAHKTARGVLNPEFDANNDGIDGRPSEPWGQKIWGNILFDGTVNLRGTDLDYPDFDTGADRTQGSIYTINNGPLMGFEQGTYFSNLSFEVSTSPWFPNNVSSFTRLFGFIDDHLPASGFPAKWTEFRLNGEVGSDAYTAFAINDNRGIYVPEIIGSVPFGPVGAEFVGGLLTKNGTAAAGSGHTIEDEGIGVTDRPILNFVGAGVTVTDDSGGGKTVVTIPGGGGGFVGTVDKGANVGVCPGQIFRDITTAVTANDTINFKTVCGVNGVSIVNGVDNIDIDGAAFITGVANIGTGTGIFTSVISQIAQLQSIGGINGIQIDLISETITVNGFALISTTTATGDNGEAVVTGKIGQQLQTRKLFGLGGIVVQVAGTGELEIDPAGMLIDTVFRVSDDMDNTKKVAFQCEGIATGTTVEIIVEKTLNFGTPVEGSVFTADAAGVGMWQPPEFKDTLFKIVDDGDGTKKRRVELVNQPTATVITDTMPAGPIDWHTGATVDKVLATDGAGNWTAQTTPLGLGTKGARLPVTGVTITPSAAITSYDLQQAAHDATVVVGDGFFDGQVLTFRQGVTKRTNLTFTTGGQAYVFLHIGEFVDMLWNGTAWEELRKVLIPATAAMTWNASAGYASSVLTAMSFNAIDYDSTGDLMANTGTAQLTAPRAGTYGIFLHGYAYVTTATILNTTATYLRSIYQPAGYEMHTITGNEQITSCVHDISHSMVLVKDDWVAGLMFSSNTIAHTWFYGQAAGGGLNWPRFRIVEVL